jgi:hypothetical protein
MGDAARTHLCWGHRVTGVPTVTIQLAQVYVDTQGEAYATDMDHDRRCGRRCTALTHQVSRIHLCKSVQFCRASPKRSVSNILKIVLRLDSKYSSEKYIGSFALGFSEITFRIVPI